MYAATTHRSEPILHAFALFGGTRGVGRALLRQALASGHRVRALVRNPSRLPDVTTLGLDDAARARLEVITGDATNEEAVRSTLEGADAVLCALGAPALSASRVRSEGTRVIVKAMKLAGLDRIVAVSVYGAAESRPRLPFWLRRVFFPLYLRRAVAEHELQERVLADSGLTWTVVRPPFLEDRPATGDYVVGFVDARGLRLAVSREDVAAFMLAEVDRQEHVGQCPGISERRRSS